MDIRVLREHATRRSAEYLDDLATLVGIDSGSYSASGVNEVASWCQDRLKRGGWKVERHGYVSAAGEMQLGDLLVATLPGSDPAGARVLISGHLDTVFDEGTVIDRPMRVQGDRVFGPGVADMKGCVLAGIYATEALVEAGFTPFAELTFVLGPDEEIGSPFSGPVIERLAKTHDLGLVLEAARAGGQIVSARKGMADLRVTAFGRAAHAGVEPEKGSSATLAAAHLVIALHALNGRWPGLTVNAGVVQGGTRSNVVADRCDIHVDLRAADVATLQAADAEIDRICSASDVPGVAIEIERLGRHAPMEATPAVAALVSRARGLAGELGFTLDDIATGGASDANTIAAVGTPVLDGLGPIGGDAHGPDEWLDLASVGPRITLLAGMIGSAQAPV